MLTQDKIRLKAAMSPGFLEGDIPGKLVNCLLPIPLEKNK